jgi:F-type H+-transporting ATPase subunit delta
MAELIDPAARVYAEALFEAAQDAGRVREVDADLSGFVGALVADRPALQALLNPQLPTEAKKRIVASLLRDADPLVRNGMLVLIENGRLSQLHDLSIAFTELAHEEEQILDVEVTTAVELGSELSGKLSQRIQEATGLQARLEERVDPGIIGGLVLRARGVLLDASVRRELDEIHRALITTPLPVGSDA